ncbi:MAG: hypothetical protein ACSLEL_04740 [Candidatus Malihini olakiniferum]
MPVYFSSQAEPQLAKRQSAYLNLRCFITKMLNQDPLRAYRKGKISHNYAALLLEFNVCWASNSLTEFQP